MSMLDKLQFWKRHPEEPQSPALWSAPDAHPPALDAPPAIPGAPNMAPQGIPGAPDLTPPPGLPGIAPPPAMNEPVTTEMTGPHEPRVSPPPSFETPTEQPTAGKDIEIITAKLDTIKAQLETLNNRMAHLERIAEGSNQPPKGW